MPVRKRKWLTAIGLIGAMSAVAWADVKKAPAKGSPAAVKKPVSLPGFTAEREAAALVFVRQHHPQLLDLLESLKKKNPARYQDAIRDLFQTSESLTELRGRGEGRYQLALEAWKLRSRSEVLAAKLKLGADSSREKELREVLAAQIDAQIRQQEMELDQLRQRSEKIEQSIVRLRGNRSKQVEARYRALVHGVKRDSTGPAPAKAAAKADQPVREGQSQ